MNIKTTKAKIKWQCRRGMLELDLLLNRFVDKHIENMSNSQLDSLQRLLNYQDPELYSWLLVDNTTSIPEEVHDLVTFIRLHTQS